MPGLRSSLAALAALRSKLEGLLASARSQSPGGAQDVPAGVARLRELAGFGSNPGNLRLLVHTPEHLPRNPPLVVALHGCGQSAADYNHGTGWSTLADRLGFVVVFPEQQPTNNPKSCFTWFLPGDIARDQGEAASIQQVVEHAIATFGIDRGRVFVTGLSAGGAMASVMLATYPEAYAGGAIIAGLPYGSAGSVQQAFEAMFTEQSPSARTLGERVRGASGHRGPWPRISVWHGTADAIVKPSNAENIIRQWADVHGLAAAPTRTEIGAGHTRRIWNDANGSVLIEAFTIAGMTHGVPISTSVHAESCGASGPFFLDVGLSSTHHIARSWGLDGNCLDIAATAATIATRPERSPAGGIGIAAAARSSATREETGKATIEPATATAPQQGAYLDPNAVIAAAFKAAGLPVADTRSTPDKTAQNFDPAAVIEAAMKAAGIKR